MRKSNKLNKRITDSIIQFLLTKFASMRLLVYVLTCQLPNFFNKMVKGERFTWLCISFLSQAATNSTISF